MMNALFRFGVGLLMLMVGCGYSLGDPKEPAKVYLVVRGNRVIEVPWSPTFSLLGAVGMTDPYSYSFSVPVHLWRHSDRKRLTYLRPGNQKQLAATRFQPDDVVIFGSVTAERAKKLEKMEVISRVLKLDAQSPPAEIDGERWVNF